MPSASFLVKALTGAIALPSMVSAAARQVTSWEENPSKLGTVLVYEPAKISAKPAIVLGLHPCGGTGQMYQSMTPLNQYADRIGFVVLYPTSHAQQGMNCWDANTKKSLLHDGGGDSQSLAGLVKWAVKEYDADTSKIFVVGGSSGAMMTNVMAATYPEVFAAGASYSGVPAACWAGSPISTPMSSDLSCPLGKKASTYTSQQWADLARACYPGYNGTYPDMMIVHGTADSAVTVNNLQAQLDQWAAVKGLVHTKDVPNDPIAKWTKKVYGDGTELVGYEVQGGGHIPPFQGDATLGFFGLV